MESDATIEKQFIEMEKTLCMDLSQIDLSELPAGSRLEQILLAQEAREEKQKKEKEVNDNNNNTNEKEKEGDRPREEKEKETEKIKEEEESFYARTSKEVKPHKWVFVCASVGDCKCFHYSSVTGQFIDITNGNRSNLTDAKVRLSSLCFSSRSISFSPLNFPLTKDPGGRLGPYVQAGEPDLRNLVFFALSLSPFIFMCHCRVCI